MSKRSLRRLAGAITVIAAAIAPLWAAPSAIGAPARAAAPAPGTVQWSVTPATTNGAATRSYFIYTARPGATITDYVAISNFSATPLTLDVYPTDAFNTADGGFGLLTKAQKPVDIGTWVGVNVTTVTVPAGKQMQVPFHVTVPQNATPGDHAGGIIAARQVPGANGNAKVIVDQRVGARIYLRVDGPLKPGLSVTRFTVDYGAALYPFGNKPATVTYTVKNTGNVQLGGSGTLSLQSLFGANVSAKQKVTVPALLPNGSYSGKLAMPGAVPAVRLTAKLELAAVNQSGVAPVTVPKIVRSSVVWPVPWLLVGVVVFLLLLWLGPRGLRRRRRGGGGSGPDGGPDDTVGPSDPDGPDQERVEPDVVAPGHGAESPRS